MGHQSGRDADSEDLHEGADGILVSESDTASDIGALVVLPLKNLATLIPE